MRRVFEYGKRLDFGRLSVLSGVKISCYIILFEISEHVHRWTEPLPAKVLEGETKPGDTSKHPRTGNHPISDYEN